MTFDTLARLINYLPPHKQQRIKEAFFLAEKRHAKQKRKSGQDYIVHPLSAAVILAKMRLDANTISAAILHDVPEDTGYPLPQIKDQFGETVARLVDGVTKLGHVRLRSEAEQQAQNIRKMVLATAQDARVILIKLADRLHNMQTIKFVEPKKQLGIARETLEIYAPLAHRLGIQELKARLEDLSFAVIHPKEFQQIKKELAQSHKKRAHYLSKIKKILNLELEKSGLKTKIFVRPKNLYAIYRNVFVEKKDKTVAQVLDIYGLRVIAETPEDCYLTLGIIHKLWAPIASRLKDYIAVPKSNDYQSLHTGVVAQDGKIVEIQIRTSTMHETAEFGLASHWRYEENTPPKTWEKEKRLAWIAELLNWQKETKSAKEFLEMFKLDLYTDEIFVFTPRGEVKNLPSQATPIDFAFSVHSELPHFLHGAKVNGQISPLNTRLKSGDVVEILTDKNSKPLPSDWLKSVKTASARTQIKKYVEKQNRENLLQFLKPILFPLKKLSQLKKTVFKTAAHPKPLSQISIGGEVNVSYQLAGCCQPKTTDTRLSGFVTRGRGITVHLSSCPVFQDLAKKEKERVVKVGLKKI